ncbi:hypothetical protein RJ639_012405 [Escallonia herrerae]|uniref:Uncharacterized protein n=1 Tax=Escallonia herrerae TaxID=1293975 RepID=A0AA88VV58_9ASTE|nr:hypothetical protein RJ639_012405 [Escallonia herrerae]
MVLEGGNGKRKEEGGHGGRWLSLRAYKGELRKGKGKDGMKREGKEMLSTRLLWFTLGAAISTAAMTHFVAKDLLFDRRSLSAQLKEKFEALETRVSNLEGVPSKNPNSLQIPLLLLLENEASQNRLRSDAFVHGALRLSISKPKPPSQLRETPILPRPSLRLSLRISAAESNKMSSPPFYRKLSKGSTLTVSSASVKFLPGKSRTMNEMVSISAKQNSTGTWSEQIASES